MKRDIDDPQVRSYLSALETRLAQLPAEQSEEILFGVREHIDQAMERGGQSMAEILAGLGSPDDIAADVAGMSTTPNRAVAPTTISKAPAPLHPRYQSSTLWVVGTCILLPFGGFLAGIGWLLGVAGLWMGTRWKLWEKIMGTVIVPGGLPVALMLAILPIRITGQSVSTGAGTTEEVNPLLPTLPDFAFVLVLVLPVLVALYLMIVGLIRGSKHS